MFDVLVLLLAVCYSSRSAIAVGQSVPDQVDRIELNHYWWTAGCESHQVILWRWSNDQQRYLAERFFFVSGDGNENPFRVGRKWRFVYKNKRNLRDVRVFETDDLIETVTSYDPWKRAQEQTASRAR